MTIDDIISLGEEMSRLRALEGANERLKGEVERVAREKYEFQMGRAKLDLAMCKLLFPEMWKNTLQKAVANSSLDKEKRHLARWAQMYRDQAEEMQNAPSLLGWSMICTYDDPSADSAQNDSRYESFALLSDGNVVSIVKLGLYGGVFNRSAPSFVEHVITEHTKQIDPQEIHSLAPQCLDAAQEVSDVKLRNE